MLPKLRQLLDELLQLRQVARRRRQRELGRYVDRPLREVADGPFLAQGAFELGPLALGEGGAERVDQGSIRLRKHG